MDISKLSLIELRAALRRGEISSVAATEAMLDSIRKPLGVRRFLSNVLHAADFTRYRIDRVPQYELRRCGLGEPPLDGTPYTGLPATGP